MLGRSAKTSRPRGRAGRLVVTCRDETGPYAWVYLTTRTGAEPIGVYPSVAQALAVHPNARRVEDHARAISA